MTSTQKANNYDIYFDADNSRLVYIGARSDHRFWDAQWLNTFDEAEFRRPYHFVQKTTERFLPRGSRVIDAGCGLARTVLTLKNAGFDAYGIDYAEQTVELVKSAEPDLQVTRGDVREMAEFPDDFFDGVWSLGVIEHFYDGYDAVLEEMKRVIKPGGFAFVTVPSLSPLRKLKASLGFYPKWVGAGEDFYQFVLNPPSVISSFERAGFRLVSTRARGGYYGLLSESGALRPILQSFFDAKWLPLRAARAGLDSLLGPISFHSKLFVFQL